MERSKDFVRYEMRTPRKQITIKEGIPIISRRERKNTKNELNSSEIIERIFKLIEEKNDKIVKLDIDFENINKDENAFLQSEILNEQSSPYGNSFKQQRKRFNLTKAKAFFPKEEKMSLINKLDREGKEIDRILIEERKRKRKERVKKIRIHMKQFVGGLMQSYSKEKTLFIGKVIKKNKELIEESIVMNSKRICSGFKLYKQESEVFSGKTNKLKNLCSVGKEDNDTDTKDSEIEDMIRRARNELIKGIEREKERRKVRARSRSTFMMKQNKQRNISLYTRVFI